MPSGRLFKNISYSYAAVFVNLVGGIAVFPILLRAIGKEKYGLFVLFLTYSANGIYSFLDLGLRGSAVKYIAEDNALGNTEGVLKIINTIFSFLLLATAASVAVNIVIYLFFLDGWLASLSHEVVKYKYLFYVFTCFNVVFFIRTALDSFLDGFQRIDDSSKAMMAQGILLMAGTCVIAIYFTARAFELYVYFVLLLEALTVLYLTIACKRVFPQFRFSASMASRETFRRIQGLGMNFFVNRLNGVAFSQAPRIILGAYSISTLAEFDIVFKFSNLMKLSMGSINRAIFPLTSGHHAERNYDKIKTTFVLSTLFSTAFASAIAVFIMVFPDKLLYFWLKDPSYQNLAGVLAYSVIWAFPVSFINAGSVMLGAVNEIRRAVAWTAAGTVLSVASAVWLVDVWGLYGMFTALFIASLFPVPVYFILIKEKLQIPYKTIGSSVLLRSFIIIASLTAICLAGRYVFVMDSLGKMLATGMIVLLASGLMSILLLSKGERALVSGVAFGKKW